MNRFVLNETSYHGAGAINAIPDEVKGRGFKKVMVASDPDLVKFGVSKKVTDVLENAGIEYELFTDIKPNPTIQNVQAGVAKFKEIGADCIVAIGGGSSMDTAKAVGIIIANPEFADVRSLEGVAPTKNKCVPIIAVPTTAGTAAEVTINYVITDAEKNRKMVCVDPHDIPVVAVVDPEMMASMPKGLTAATGMDALTHAVEAYLSRFYPTRQTDRLAEEAVVTIFRTLEHACAHGDDVDARQALLTASYQAGAAFTRASVGNVHAIAHTLGGLYGVGHGLANAVLLPVVLRDYGPAAYRKLARLAELVGLPGGTDGEKADAFIDAILAMNARLGIPTGFSCIREEDLPQMAAWAAKEANPTYPVPVIYDRGRFIRVIRQVMQ